MPAHSQRHGVVLGIASLAAFMASLDVFIVNVAFNDIGRDFSGASLSELSWVLNAYAIVYAALLVPAGRMADRYGRKGGFLAGLAVFTASSAACAASAGVWWLVAFRVLQAAGAAVLTPASLGLVVASAPPERRARSVRIWAATGALAAALGPAVGGMLVEASWRWVFLVNVPVGVRWPLSRPRYGCRIRATIGHPHARRHRRPPTRGRIGVADARLVGGSRLGLGARAGRMSLGGVPVLGWPGSSPARPGTSSRHRACADPGARLRLGQRDGPAVRRALRRLTADDPSCGCSRCGTTRPSRPASRLRPGR